MLLDAFASPFVSSFFVSPVTKRKNASRGTSSTSAHAYTRFAGRPSRPVSMLLTLLRLT